MKRQGLIIYPKDIQRITGRGEAHARRMFRMIKQKLGKESHQFVTYDEFCEFSGLKKEDIDKYL